jgi:hypothetical protein
MAGNNPMMVCLLLKSFVTFTFTFALLQKLLTPTLDFRVPDVRYATVKEGLQILSWLASLVFECYIYEISLTLAYPNT